MPEPETPQIPPEMIYKSKLIETLYDDPETRPELLKIIKKKVPQIRIPEIDTPAEVQAQMEPIVKRLEEKEAKLTEQLAKIETDRGREAVAKKHGLTEQDIPEVEKLMAEGISDFGMAAEHYTLRRNVAAPRQPRMGMQLPSFEGLFKNPQQWARDEAHRVLAETRRS